jgi:predicted O-methyltransferase YrrM
MIGSVRGLAKHAWVSFEGVRLAAVGEHRLARALRRRDCALCEQIEHWRADLLQDNSLLVDGSEGPAGIYDEGQTVADACRVSKPKASARLLHSLAAEYRPENVLELGTNVGISSAYLAAAGCRVTTLEASPYRLRLAKGLHGRLGLQLEYVQGLFTDTLAKTLAALPPVQMAFVDGHHQYEPTLRYFEAIAEKAAPNCVFIFDDIRWSDGMRRAWKELKANPDFQTVADLGDMGVAITSNSTLSA